MSSTPDPTSTPEPTSTPGPPVPDPSRPASDPDQVQPTGPGPVPDDTPDPNVEPDLDTIGATDAPGPEETNQGLRSQPDPPSPSADDPGSQMNF